MKQLCWNCKNTNRFKCEWFENCNKVPDYVKTRNGYIVECERFEREKFKPYYDYKNILNYYSIETISKCLGVSKRLVLRSKQKYFSLFIKKYIPPMHK